MTLKNITEDSLPNPEWFCWHSEAMSASGKLCDAEKINTEAVVWDFPSKQP